MHARRQGDVQRSPVRRRCPEHAGRACAERRAGCPRELERLRRESKVLEKERHAREAVQAREEAQAGRQALRRREKCEQLQLARKWAEEDARRADPQAEEAARLKARRAAERYAAACK